MTLRFVCDRRDDTAGYAGWHTENLEEVYGKGSVFIDVHMRGGSEFPREISFPSAATRGSPE